MYRIIRFGETSLEYANQEDNISSGETPTAFRALPDGGAIDAYGDTRKRPGAVERVVKRRLTAASVSALEEIYFGLMALVGTRDKLYRRTATGRVHFQYARLVDISAARTYELTKYRYIQDVELRFVTLDAYWQGAQINGWTLDDGHNLDYAERLDQNAKYNLTTSPTVAVLSLIHEPGMAPIRAIEIVVEPGGDDMAPVYIARTGGEQLVYAGVVPAAGQLSIDAGAMQVACTGAADAYDNLLFAPAADLASWFSLVPGVNQIQMSFSGGSGATIEFVAREAWY